MARSDIVAAYQKYLGRAPDAAGLEYWTGNLSSGKESLDSILSNIQNSAEAQAYTPPPAAAAPTFTPVTITPNPSPSPAPTYSPASELTVTGQDSVPTSTPTYSPATPTSDPTPYITHEPTSDYIDLGTGLVSPNTHSTPIGSTPDPNTGWIQDAYTAAGLGQADQAGLDYWSDNFTSGQQTQEQVESNIALHSPLYRGPEDTAFNRTVDPYTGDYRKKSKNSRTIENEHQYNILDELTRHVEGYGIGDFTISEGSVPQWVPISDFADEPNWDLDQYRNQDARVAEDIWQQGQIGDLEAWAQSVAGDYGLSFEPTEAYHGYDKHGNYSKHTNEGRTRNISQSAGIENIADFVSKLDAARAPELAANRESLSSIYGAEIDRTYNELFETDNEDSEYYGKNIDQAGKEYWTKNLLDNEPGLTEGQNWQDWLERAFKNTESYKDFIVGKGAQELEIPGVGEDGQFIDPDPIETPDFEAMLADEREKWGLELSNFMNENNTAWTDRITSLTDTYSTQISSLQDMLAESSRNNADMLKGYQDQVASYQKSLESQAAYGERPSNQEVKGVRTLNELPGYKPKTGGTTGHFNRKGSRLTTSSLNIA